MHFWGNQKPNNQINNTIYYSRVAKICFVYLRYPIHITQRLSNQNAFATIKSEQTIIQRLSLYQFALFLQHSENNWNMLDVYCRSYPVPPPQCRFRSRHLPNDAFFPVTGKAAAQRILNDVMCFLIYALTKFFFFGLIVWQSSNELEVLWTIQCYAMIFTMGESFHFTIVMPIKKRNCRGKATWQYSWHLLLFDMSISLYFIQAIFICILFRQANQLIQLSAEYIYIF